MTPLRHAVQPRRWPARVCGAFCCPSSQRPTGTLEGWPRWRSTAGLITAAQMQVGGWPVLAYAQPAGALTPVDASFADGVTLRGSVMAADALSPGGLLTLHLDWTQPGAGVDAPPSDLKVFVQLLDRSGALVAQDDRPLMFSGPHTAGSGLAVYGLALPAELSDGPYRLITGLYDPAQAGAPRVLTADGADHVVLREF